MDEEEQKAKEKADGNLDERDKHETAKIIKRQSERIKELEDADFKREEVKAKKQLGGETKGQEQVKKETTDEDRIQYAQDALKGNIHK